MNWVKLSDYLPTAWRNVEWVDESHDTHKDSRFVGQILEDSDYYGNFYIVFESVDDRNIMKLEFEKSEHKEYLPGSNIEGEEIQDTIERFWSEKYIPFKKFAT